MKKLFTLVTLALLIVGGGKMWATKKYVDPTKITNGSNSTFTATTGVLSWETTGGGATVDMKLSGDLSSWETFNVTVADKTENFRCVIKINDGSGPGKDYTWTITENGKLSATLTGSECQFKNGDDALTVEDLKKVISVYIGGFYGHTGSATITNMYLSSPVTINLKAQGFQALDNTDIDTEGDVTFNESTGVVTATGTGKFKIGVTGFSITELQSLSLDKIGDDILGVKTIKDANNGTVAVLGASENNIVLDSPKNEFSDPNFSGLNDGAYPTKASGWSLNINGTVQNNGGTAYSGPRIFALSACPDMTRAFYTGWDSAEKNYISYGENEKALTLEAGLHKITYYAMGWKSQDRKTACILETTDGTDILNKTSATITAWTGSSNGDKGTTNNAQKVECMCYVQSAGDYVLKLKSTGGEVLIGNVSIDKFVEGSIFADTDFSGTADNFIPTLASGWSVYHDNTKREAGSNQSGGGARIFALTNTPNLERAFYSDGTSKYIIYGENNEGAPRLYLNKGLYKIGYYAVGWNSNNSKSVFSLLDGEGSLVQSFESVTLTTTKNNARDTEAEATKIEHTFFVSTSGYYELKFNGTGSIMLGNVNLEMVDAKTVGQNINEIDYDITGEGTFTINSLKLNGNYISAVQKYSETSITEMPFYVWTVDGDNVGTVVSTASGMNNNIGNSSDFVYGYHDWQDTKKYIDITDYESILIKGISSNKKLRFFINWVKGTDSGTTTKTEYQTGEIFDNSEVKEVEIKISDIKSTLSCTNVHLIGVKTAYGQNATIDYIKFKKKTQMEIAGSGENSDALTAALADASATYIDATGLTNTTAIELTSANPNCIFKAAEGKLSNANNVMVGTTIASLALTDGKPFAAPAEATATAATYTRAAGGTYGTICLPYAVSSNENVQYYKLTSADENKVTITKVDNVAAGTPAIFKNIGGATNLTITGSGALAAAKDGSASTGTVLTMKGTYTQKVITAAAELAKTYYISGDKVMNATSKLTINPFRAYMEAAAPAGARMQLVLSDDNVTAINAVFNAENSDVKVVSIYGANGAQQDGIKKGMNIVKLSNGKTQKILVK